MTSRRLLLCLIAACFASTLAAAPPAAAAGSGTFQCGGNFPVWPTSGGSSTWCTGRAQGVFQGGAELVVCLPDCYFEISIDYSNTCILNEPPGVTFLSGDLEIWGAGVLKADYSATVVGTHVSITTSNPTGVGEAAITYGLPIPTCASPGPLRFEMAGWLAFS